MYRYCILLIFLCNSVICEDCVTVDFENGFEDDFSSNNRVCIGLSPWNVKEYSSGNVDSPHVNSTSFITPQPGIGCVSSFNFTIGSGSTLEVNVYTMLGTPFDLLTVRVFQSIVGGEDVLIGTAVHIPKPVPDWETISMTIDGLPSSFEGYIVFQSMMLSMNTIIKIDSFRYIGPSSDKNSCVIYEEDQTTTLKPTTTTTEATTTTTTTTTVATTTTTTEATSTTSTTEAPKEDCVTANFEYNFEHDFTNNYGECVGFSTWNIETYSTINMERPHPRSTSFITPQAGISCVSSFNFTMTAGGTLEVNVYTMPVSTFDQLTVRVYEYVVEGNDILVNTAFHVSNSVPEWEIIRMIINGNGSFEGYVTFQAWTVSTNPIIRIDSFRYIAPSFDEDLCTIYEEELTTVEPTTTTTEAPNEDCVTVNFENNFEENFTNNYSVCDGFSVWNVQQYSTVNIEGPHPKSTRFITPETGTSCVSSFRFTITAGGTLEVNLFMIPISPFDQLNVRVFQYVLGGDDIQVGTAFHFSNTVPVWENISMTINGNGSFEGYVTFQTWAVATNPVIWIDSFRYVAPSFDKGLCVVYEEDQTTTIKPTTTTTTPIITTTEATTTTTTKAPNEDCVTVDFESKFENNFTNSYGVCFGQSAWNIKKYSSVDIDSPHPGSANFIRPETGMSCVSSFKFSMAAGGFIEVNLYMIVVSAIDQLSLTVFQSNDEGNDLSIGRVFLNSMLTEFVPGWQKINMTIDGPEKFDGYVTFHAISMSPDPIIWIDSFRYIGPSSDMDSCVIYRDDATITKPPTTTTTEAPIEDCVTEDFEYNFEDNFTNNNTECAGLSSWDTKQYSSVEINSPHPNSTRFIAPQLGLSCVSSFKFTMTTGGTLEVNIYMMAATIHNQLDVSVFQSVAGGRDAFISGVSLNHQTTNFVPGWQTVRITIGGSGIFEGYVEVRLSRKCLFIWSSDAKRLPTSNRIPNSLGNGAVCCMETPALNFQSLKLGRVVVWHEPKLIQKYPTKYPSGSNIPSTESIGISYDLHRLVSLYRTFI